LLKEIEMPNIQVAAERRLQIIEAHRLWQQSLPRAPGQIGSAITALVEGPPIILAGRIESYSDYNPVRFISVVQAFLDYLDEQGIPYEQN
jgi:hypothetical protein